MKREFLYFVWIKPESGLSAVVSRLLKWASGPYTCIILYSECRQKLRMWYHSHNYVLQHKDSYPRGAWPNQRRLLKVQGFLQLGTEKVKEIGSSWKKVNIHSVNSPLGPHNKEPRVWEQSPAKARRPTRTSTKEMGPAQDQWLWKRALSSEWELQPRPTAWFQSSKNPATLCSPNFWPIELWVNNGYCLKLLSVVICTQQ